MATEKLIEGQPYSARFVVQADDGDGWTDAYVAVEPPVILGNPLTETLFTPGIEWEAYATTMSKTVLHLALQERTDRDDSHEERADILFNNMQGVIERLNEIESNEYPKGS